MARRGRTENVSEQVVEPVDVDVDVADETEEVAAPTEPVAEEKAAKAAKAKKEPKRGELPEGHVTPVGLAKLITEKGLHKNRDGEVVELKPQMVYSYIKNAPKEDPFPFVEGGVTDSVGTSRPAAPTDKALEWWNRKVERAAARKASAADKASKKAEKASSEKSDSTPTDVVEETAVEAE